MSISEIHYTGGILFMSVLSILLLIVISLAIFAIVKLRHEKTFYRLKTIMVEVGLLALVWGILGQLVGLLGAFQAIEAAGDVSMGLLAGGLKVSSYTTIYGVIIFVLSRLLKIGLVAVRKN